MLKNVKPVFSSWAPTLFGGVFIGLIHAFFAVSIAALIYTDQLKIFLESGVSMMLIGYIVLSMIIALFGSRISNISSVQEAPAVILATIVNSMALSARNTAESDLFSIVIGAIVVSSVTTGLIFYLLGRFKLGDLIRYMPYPVVAGFLAGTGVILLHGGFDLIIGSNEHLSPVKLFDPVYWPKWVLGILFGLLLFITLKKYNNIFVLPVSVCAAISLFYLAAFGQGYSMEEIRNEHWLLISVSENASNEFAFFSFAEIDWLFVLSHIVSGMPALIFVSIIAYLLNINAIELMARQDIELNKSLKVTGVANIASGLCGAAVGFSSVDMAVFSFKMNILDRSIGLLSALTTAVMLAYFLQVLNYLPGFIFGGFFIYIGLDIIYDWAYGVWFRLNKMEYFIVISVMAIIVFIGFMQGVAAGVVISLVIFAINFSNVSIIKNSLSGSELQSNTQRGEVQQKLLIEQGDRIQLFMLTGFLFFGTANKLCVQLKERVASTQLPAVKYIIFDWKQVTGMDSSTIYSLQKIQQLSLAESIQLIMTNVPNAIRIILDNNLVDSTLLKYFPDLNHGLDWCENEILVDFEQDKIHYSFEEVLSNANIKENEINKIKEYFSKKTIPSDYYLIRQGDPAETLYFIESGSLDVFFELEDGGRIYIQRISTGLFVVKSV